MIGTSGAMVDRIKMAMIALGYPDDKGSVYTKDLSEMVADYQSKKGLKVDGLCGPITFASMEKDINLFDHDKFAFRPLQWCRSSRLINNGKKSFALHHTAGGPDGLTVPMVFDKRTYVGTSYALGGDGTIVQMLIDPFKDWAYHLNMAADYTVGAVEEKKAAMESISIEICNWGPLTFDTTIKKYRTYTGQIYEGKVVDYHEIYGKDYRGFRYYQAYTNKQIEALALMLRVIMPRLGVQKPKTWTIKDFDASASNVRQVIEGKMPLFHHAQVRKTKSDLHPQPELISVLSTYDYWTRK